MKSIYNLDEVKNLIDQGKVLSIAADSKLLDQLPKGNWIGGTIPYFIGDNGGVCTKDQLFVTILPSECKVKTIGQYSANHLGEIAQDYSRNGFSLVIIPATSDAHIKFANEYSQYDGAFNSPLVGWISGVHLDDLEKETAMVYDGLNGNKSNQDAVVLHIDLPENVSAQTEILNLFEQGEGDVIEFETEGFIVENAIVNGERVNFSEYLKVKNISLELPLVANYSGAMINVSYQANDTQNKQVHLYAPVFQGVEYRMAKPVANYQESFESQLAGEGLSPVFSCNCILNYLYANLEGKKPGGITGPITFGEIAYMLLNQTMVYINLVRK